YTTLFRSLDGPRAEEEPRTNLRVRQPVTGQLGDLPLLRGQIVPGLDSALARVLPRREQLAPGALGEPIGSDAVEHAMGSTQLVARIHTPVLPAQPLAIEKLGPRLVKIGRAHV